MDQIQKKCSVCNAIKTASEFGKNNRGNLNSRCRSCDREYAREYRRKNPEKVKESKRRAKYNMTSSYKEMLNAQNGRCKVCNVHAEDVHNKVLHVDHCHSTGQVRGLLCSNCNTALGLLKDNLYNIERLFNYLKESNGNSSTL